MEIQTHHHLYPPPSNNNNNNNVLVGGFCGSQDYHNHNNVSIVDHGFGFNTNNYNFNHSPNLPLFFQNQRNHLDQILMSQYGTLRVMWEEHAKQQATTLLKRAEPIAVYMLNQKDIEIEKAMKEMADLEAFVTRLEAENQLWQRAAQDKEEMIMQLNQSLENVKERDNFFNNNNDNEVVGEVIVEDSESCNDQNWGRMRMEEITREKKECSRKMNRVCKNCDSGRSSCIMFLPCRHLCSCKLCEPFLHSCPICTMPKKNTIQIRDFDFSY